MKTRKYITLLFILISIGLSAQNPVKLGEIKSEMSKLTFMTGNWSGSGWNMGRDRMKHDFSQTENITFKLDSTIILIEGLGKSDGDIVHNALAIISYDPETKEYNFKSYLSDGLTGDFKGSLNNNTFVWELNENMRYRINIKENGDWYEIGEYLMGEDWFQIFEMTLEKK